MQTIICIRTLKRDTIGNLILIKDARSASILVNFVFQQRLNTVKKNMVR